MLCKKSAISSLMLELDSDDLPQWGRNVLNNALAVEVVTLTKDIRGVENLLGAEKEKIERRGKDPSNYLMSDFTTIERVYGTFYQNVYIENNGNRTIKDDLVISEYMIILGAFTVIRELHQKIIAKKRKEIAKMQPIFKRRYGYYLADRNRMQLLDEALEREDKLKIEIAEEEKLVKVLDENIAALFQIIFGILGRNDMSDISVKDKDNLLSESKKLSLSYRQLRTDFKERAKNFSLYDEALILDVYGESSPLIQEILESQKKRQYVKVMS